MEYDFESVLDRTGTDCLKWDHMAFAFGRDDLLPMWVADMDFASPPEVVEALVNRARHGAYGYTMRPESFFEAIADWMLRRFNWSVNREWMVITPGVVPALHFAVQACCRPGDSVIVQPPVYYPFFAAAKANGCEVAHNPLTLRDGKYRMDLDGLSRILDTTPGARMLVLCSPHNPVGRVWEEDELKALEQVVLQRDLVVVSDEIHADLILPGHRQIPFSSLSPALAARTITCTAPSKTFNLAGLQVSTVMISDPGIRREFERAMSRAGLWLSNLFGIVAAETAYRNGEPWLTALLAHLHRNVLRLEKACGSELGPIRLIRPEGTYLAWLDCRDLGLTDEGLRELVRVRARLGLDDGPVFGPGGSGFQRINLACPSVLLEEGIQQLKRALEAR